MKIIKMINFDLNDCDENDLTRKSDLPFKHLESSQRIEKEIVFILLTRKGF